MKARLLWRAMKGFSHEVSDANNPMARCVRIDVQNHEGSRIHLPDENKITLEIGFSPQRFIIPKHFAIRRNLEFVSDGKVNSTHTIRPELSVFRIYEPGGTRNAFCLSLV